MTKGDGSPEAGMRVESRMFLGISTVLAVLFVVYLLTADERSGAVLLLLAAAMGVLMGGYLALQARKHAGDDPGQPGGEPAEAEEYLPHASIWPFGMGMGAVMVANGLALGLWAILPGAVLGMASVWGYARQSRRRD